MHSSIKCSIIIIIITQKPHYTKLTSLHHGLPVAVVEGIIIIIIIMDKLWNNKKNNERVCRNIKTEKAQ